MSKQALKNHYFLIAATCVTIAAADRELAKSPDAVVGVSRVPVQVLLVQPEREFTFQSIARAQQGAQQSLYKVVHKDTVDVVDVIIDNISHLGFMTADKFHGPKSAQELTEEAIAVARQAGVEAAHDGKTGLTGDTKGDGHIEEQPKD